MSFEKGRTKTGGRRAGTPNKATAIARASAEPHLTRMIEILAEIAEDDSKPAAVRVAAARDLIHLASGRPTAMPEPEASTTDETAPVDMKALLRQIREEVYGLKPETNPEIES